MAEQPKEGVVEVHSVLDATRLSEEAVEAEAAKFNADGSPKVTEEKKADTAVAAADDKGDEKDADGVLAADGKHILPYGVLKGTREAQAQAEGRAREAEETAKTLREENERLKAGGAVDAGKAADTADRIATLREQADAIRETLPAMAEMFDTLIEEIETTRGKLVAHDTRAQEEQAAAVGEVKTRVRTAIDSNPTLALWEAESPEAFNKAVDFDEVLKADPRWKGKSFEDRFAHAVKLTLVDMPDAPLPKNAPTNKEVKERADKVLRDAGDVTVTSLSDLPGGASPGGNPLENIEAIPAAALANQMAKMSDAQLQDFIAKHG